METPKHLKIQTLVAFLMLLFGSVWISSNSDPKYGGGLLEAMPAIIGFFWLIGALFTVWWKK